MSIFNLHFLAIFPVLVPLFIILSSGQEISTVVFNATRMSEIIDHFMSSNITEDDLFSSSSTFKTSSSSSSKSFTIPIFNKELLTKSQFKDHESLVQARIRNDISRIKKLNAGASHFDQAAQVNPNDYDVPYFGFLSDLEGVYIVAFKVGNPLVRQALVFDPELTWWHCNPCKNCIKRTRLYDPRRSSTHKTITCDDPICEEHKFACRFVDNNCAYKINYADKGYTRGEVAYDKLSTTTGTVMLDRMLFGCSREVAEFDQHEGKVTGVLGFNRGKYSLLSQMNAQNFTVCLPAHYGQGKNELRIHVLPPYYYPDSITVPLMDNARKPSFYVGINGISVGGERVNVPDDAWKILPNGKGGTIIDFGTFLTWLRSDIFYPFNELFIKKAAALGLPVRRISEGLYRSCFKMTTPTSTNIPSVEFHFEGIYATYKLGPEHIMIQAGNTGFYCLAFAEETELSFSLIGSWQLQKTRLAVDIANRGLNINPNFANS